MLNQLNYTLAPSVVNFTKCCKNIERLVLKLGIVEPFNGVIGRNNILQKYLYSFIGTSNEWLLHQYPNLEYSGLHFVDNYNCQTDELKISLQQNPNIRKLATYAENFVYPASRWLYEANLQLDDLAITMLGEPKLTERIYPFLSNNNFSKRTQVYGMNT